MSLKNVIKRLFKLLHILGISPATFCERQRKLIVTRKSEKYMLRFTIVMVVIMEFFFILICVLSFSDAFKVYDSSKTGNKLIFIQLLESVGIQLFLTIMFYVFRHKNVKIFEQIFKFAERINSEECNKRIIRRFYIQYQLNIILIILFIGNITILGTTTDRFSIIMYICNVVVLAIYFIYISIYLTCFTCLIFVAVESMRFLNNCIRMTQSTKELMKLLNLRQKLLFMCQDLELVYGLVILLQAGFTVTSISAFFFLTTVAFEWLNQKISTILYVILQTSLYAMPPLIIFVKAIWANDIDKEANKTARILARIPRTKTSLDQMIDKFLWKNLRPKPILTAYGFFSLDKSTLFKLFTAIFTYMVILVQFKDMENNTKIQHSNKT